MQSHVNKFSLYSVASVTILVTIILLLIKLYAWQLTASIAVLATTVDSLLDLFAAIINFSFLALALKPADTGHRFGHGKAEALGGLFQSALILLSVFFLLSETYQRWLSPQQPENTGVGIQVMIISLVLLLLLYVLQRVVAKKTASLIVSGNAIHNLGDILLNAGVLLSLLLASHGATPLLDTLMALIITLVMLYSVVHLLKRTIEQLMDAELSGIDRLAIESRINGHAGVEGIRELRTRRSGFATFIQFDVLVSAGMTVQQADVIRHNIIADLHRQFPDAEIFVQLLPKQNEPSAS